MEGEENLPRFISRDFSLSTKGKMFDACVRSVVLYGSKV